MKLDFIAWWVGCSLATGMVVGLARPEPATVQKNKTEADGLFTNGVILHLRLEMPEAAVESLRQDPRKYVAATLREGDLVYSNVLVHLKGSAGSFRKVDDKPGFTLNLKEADETFHGLRKFHLNNSVQDSTYLSEWLCSDLFRAAQVPATRAAHAVVDLNGRKLGLYVLVESVNRDFLARYFHNTHGNVYGQSANGDVTDPLERMEGRGENTRTDLKALAAAAQERDRTRLWPRLQAVLDVDEYVTFMAMEVMLCHWDGYTFAAHNFRVCQNPDNGKMVFVPHDLDQMLGDANAPIHPGANGLVSQAILRSPEGRKIYLERFGALYTNVFLVPMLTNRIDMMVGRLVPALTLYDADLAREVQQHARGLKSRIAGRALGLAQQLAQGVPANLVLEGHVFDAESLKPVNQFSIVPGFGQANDAVEWDRTHVYQAEGGSFQVDLAGARLPQIPGFLRFESAGYQPAVVRFIPSTNTEDVVLKVALKKGSRLTGVVLLPDGTPARGAQVALVTQSGSPALGRGHFVPKPGAAIFRVQDRPRFTFAADTEALAVVAVHESGFVQAPVENPAAPFRLTLQPWGRLEGTMTGGGSTAPAAVAVLTPELLIPNLFNGLYAGTLNLDSADFTVEVPGDGRWVLDKIPPGERYLWRSAPINAASNTDLANLSFVGQRLLVKPGETNHVAWRANEWSLRGRLVLATRAAGEPGKSPPGDASPAATPFKFGLLRLTSAAGAGPPAEEFVFSFGNQDSFRVVGLKPGQYQAEWRLFSPPLWLGRARQDLEIPAVPHAVGATTVELGSVEAQRIQAVAIGQPAPAFELSSLDGGALRLADFRGKWLLLYFWATWCSPQHSVVPSLKAIAETYREDSRLVLLGLNLDQDSQTARRYVSRANLKGRQAFLGEWFQTALPAEYGAANIPAAMLLGPEGNLLARNVSFGDLAAAIKKALEGRPELRASQK